LSSLGKARGGNADVSTMFDAEGSSFVPYPSAYSDMQAPVTVTSAQHEHSDLRAFLTLLRRHVVLIAVVTIVTGLATYAFSVQQAKQYAGKATLLYAASSTSEDPTRAVNTIVGVSSSSAVLSSVAKKNGTTLGQLENALTVTGNPDTDIINVTVHSSAPEQAARIANDVASALIAYSADNQRNVTRSQISSLRRQLAALGGRTDAASISAAANLRAQLAQATADLTLLPPALSVLSPAVTPTGAFSPHPKRDAVIGLLVGLVLGILLAVLRERLDRRIRDVEEVEAIYRAPTLGLVPFRKGRRASRAKTLADFGGASLLADAYRTIRTNLSLLQLETETPVIVVTSATSEEGKSTVAANLAHVLSVTGKHVLAVSADLHNPTLHEYFPALQEGFSARMAEAASTDGLVSVGEPSKRPSRSSTALPGARMAGLVQVLGGEVTLSSAARPIPLSVTERGRGGSLHLLANSSTFFDPTVLLSSRSMREFLEEARRTFDVVILDTPPVLANADATALAQEADVLVVVARLDHLTKHQARRAAQIIAAARLRPSGVIVTGDVEQSVYGYRYDYQVESSTNGSDGHSSTAS
jgi:Mrp family chromosome partitioning ATPase/capsular polysaccharide biosynthesis protein